MENKELIEALGRKLAKHTWNGIKKTGKAIGSQLAKSADTARNATVAGIVTPTVAVPTANKINQSMAHNKKEKKYSAAEVQAMAAAMNNKHESLSERLIISSKKLKKLL